MEVFVLFQYDIYIYIYIYIYAPANAQTNAPKNETTQTTPLLISDSLYRTNLDLLYQRIPKNKVISATSTIYTEDLIKSSANHVNNALTGRLAGLFAVQIVGQPGFSGATASLRGVTPVIIMDGVVRDMMDINPEQIESVTVLKDGLGTAMLGNMSSRGAILITTKKGRQGQLISGNVQTGIQKPMNLPKVLNAYDYARLYNEALANDGNSTVYTQADLDAYKNHTDFYGHPDVNWYDQILKNSAPATRADLTVTGGGKAARYFVSLDYLNQQGLFITEDFNTYNTNTDYSRFLVRSNVDVDLSPSLNVGLNLMARILNGNSPGYSSAWGATQQIFGLMLATPNNAYPKLNPDGSLGGTSEYQNNIYGAVVKSGYIPYYYRDVMTDVYLKKTLDEVTKGLWVKGLVSFNAGLEQVMPRYKTFAVYKMNINSSNDTTYQKYGTDGEQSNSAVINQQTRGFYAEVSVGYDRSFGGHNVSALAMGNVREETNWSYLPEKYTNFGLRGTYDYQGKYMVEAVATYSGYNEFAPGKRYGMFGSIGAGWNVMKEDFMQGKLPWLNELKLRATYGKTGNVNVGYYVYKQYYGDNPNGGNAYTYGSAATGSYGVRELAPLANPDVTWEKAHKFNVGVDAAMFKNKLAVSMDYYTNKYFDLMQLPGHTYALLGNTYPLENIGKNRFSGFELQISYTEQSNNRQKVGYFISGNLSLEKTKVLYCDEVYRQNDYQKRTGQRVGQGFGYIADGFFQSQAEIDASPQMTGYTAVPGDIKFKDLNGDNVINELDQAGLYSNKPIGYWGANFGVNWKGFDFTALLIGAFNRQSYISGAGEWEFMDNGNNGKQQAYENNLNRWTPQTATTATYPRLSVGANINNQAYSSFWLQSTNFIRLKNVELGYSLPEAWMKKIRFNSVRIFVNAMNSITISDFDRRDPESFSVYYPALKTFNTGLTFKF